MRKPKHNLIAEIVNKTKLHDQVAFYFVVSNNNIRWLNKFMNKCLRVRYVRGHMAVHPGSSFVEPDRKPLGSTIDMKPQGSILRSIFQKIVDKYILCTIYYIYE